mgnify:CR=1 FL=1
MRAAVAVKVPELSTTDVGVASGTELRSHLFAGMLGIFRFLGQSRRLVLFVDDVQYADAATLKVLTYLIRHDRRAARTGGVSMFAAVATDTAAAMAIDDTAFGKFMAAMDRCATAGVAELAPLNSEQTTEMVDACFPRNSFPREFAQKVYRVARGIR